MSGAFGKLTRMGSKPGELIRTKPEAHGHSHELGEPQPSRNEPLVQGAGKGRTLFLDTPSGIAGDMTIAALLDLGVPFAVVEAAVAGLALSGCVLHVAPARAGMIGGTRFRVEESAPQPQRRYAEIDALIGRASLDDETKRLARAIFARLARAEAEVHRVPIESVEFHEVGSVDSIVDIVGAAACFAYLGARVVASPLPMGKGFVRCQHGRLPLPAPATLLCLAGVPSYDSGLDVELVTPTGAAIVATVAEQFTRWPSFVIERVGFGCGTRKLPDRPNALRAVLGSESSETAPRATHILLEANVDDMTGELAAHAIELLLAAGALDAWAQPITMKKGRPGLTLSVLCERAQSQPLAALMLRETSSIGLRQSEVSRTERPRRMLSVETRFGSVPVKLSEGDFGPALAKPEFDVCARLAKQAGVPVREAIAAALAALPKEP
ncbi:MAG: nickel pincer cofactor biosynthesis protein LarC [Polyangiaceae bacterium]